HQKLRPPGFPAAHDREPARPRGRRLGADVPGQGHGVGARHRLGPGLPRGSHGHGEAGQQEVARMLRLNNVEVVYDRAILVLKGISLDVPEQRIITLLGSNGAGKSTTLKAISGLLKPERGEITRGSVEFNGERIDHRGPEEIVKLGITQVMEGRRVFDDLTTEENLLSGAHTRRGVAEIRADLAAVYEYFPGLAERRTLKAGYLSGGEQQMLAIGRALMARPKLMLLDEPSLGLAPPLVEEIFQIIQRLNRQEELTALLVEQNAAMALTIAEHGYIMANGRMVLDGPVEALGEDDFVATVAADDRINARVEAVQPPQVSRLNANLADQICQAAGRRCSYLGRDMKDTHKGMNITEAEWNATVEALVKALDKDKV